MFRTWFHLLYTVCIRARTSYYKIPSLFLSLWSLLSSSSNIQPQFVCRKYAIFVCPSTENMKHTLYAYIKKFTNWVVRTSTYVVRPEWTTRPDQIGPPTRLVVLASSIMWMKKKNNTRDSNVVPHRSTNLARRCLTSLSRREAVLSSWYGRSWQSCDLQNI